MIQMSEALGWINHFDRSHLNGTNHRLFAEARKQRTNDAAIPDLVRTALQQARTSPHDGLDYAETLLNCGLIEYNRGLLEPARDHLASALNNYVKGRDVHGSAVACWMLGITELALPDTDASYRNWKRSLRTFGKFRVVNTHIPTTRDWYTDIYTKMNKDLVTLPQEAFTWINQFSGSRLSHFNHDLVELIQQYIKSGNRDEADRIVNLLKEKIKISPDLLECAEIYAETGLARFRMREGPLAIQDLKTALLKYPSDSHQQECLRWMLGAVQLWFENQRVDALKNWEQSIEGFKKLAKRADQNNQGSQKRWYREKMVYMKGALKGKLAERPSGNGMAFTPPADGYSRAEIPSPPDSDYASDKGQSGQDLYQDLLSKVRGDAAIAERLVEYERERAPNASGEELIRRAIERWEHDNR